MPFCLSDVNIILNLYRDYITVKLFYKNGTVPLYGNKLQKPIQFNSIISSSTIKKKSSIKISIFNLNRIKSTYQLLKKKCIIIKTIKFYKIVKI